MARSIVACRVPGYYVTHDDGYSIIREKVSEREVGQLPYSWQVNIIDESGIYDVLASFDTLREAKSWLAARIAGEVSA